MSRSTELLELASSLIAKTGRPGQVDDLEAEVRRLGEAGFTFRNEIITGPGGSQILLDDPSGNLVELFQPANT